MRRRVKLYKILIVDDEKDVVDSIREVLKVDGYTVFDADGGEKALEIVSKERPEVVFLDIRMEGMDGLQVLERIKAINRETKVIMISALVDLETRKRAQELGCDAYLRKPFDIDDVDKALSVKLNELVSDPSILVVEDDIGVFDFIKELFEGRMRVKITNVESGEEAIEKIKNEHFNIIFIDIGLPGMNGFSVANEVGKIDPYTDMIIITTLVDQYIIDEAVGNGAVEMMEKPLKTESVVKKVTNLLQKRGFNIA
jgi:two-component system, response regulator, stage 0 sporulation protein F